MNKVHIIAEVATNYFDSVYLAEQSIIKAKEAGADSIKIQIIHSPETYLEGTYKYGKYKVEDVRNLRKISFLSDEKLKHLKKFAKKNKIFLTATIYGEESLRKSILIDPIYLKIASGDVNNKELINLAIEKKKKIIISTGMANESEIKRVISHFNKKNFKNYVLMHCVADYPHETQNSQLGYLNKLRELNINLGFSDHTLGTSSAAVAVAFGVKWIEKHFTLSSDLGGLDAKHSLNTDQLKNYIKEIRGIEKSLLLQKRIVTKNEIYTSKRARRGLYLSKDIKKNQIIKRSDLLLVRPENQFDIWNFDKIIKKKLKKNLKKNKIITFKDIK